MHWSFLSDITDFTAEAEPLLLRDEAANGLILGVSSVLRAEPERAALLAVSRDLEGEPRAGSAALQVRDANLVLAHAPAGSVELLARELSRRGADLPGVVGPAREAELFAAQFGDLMGRRFVLGMDQLIYRLTRVKPPPKIEGALLQAGASETEIVADWLEDFRAEAIPHETANPTRSLMMAEKRVRAGEIFVWEVNGKPVAMAGIAGPTKNGIRINAVFTPRARRRQGFASALVAALSQKMLDRGKTFCCLYTDVSNPTSNRIYQNIGYEPVCESRHYVFV